MLFYWFSADRPNTVGIDNTWWWTGVVIRLAQQMRLHRHSSSTLPQCEGDSPGLRRRIWWTLVARERISCISQGRPCVIDPADCTNPMPTKEDFPDPDGIGTSVFLSWLNLCDIVGDIGTKIRRDLPFSEIASGRTLIQWVENLPSSLHLPIGGERTIFLHPEVHGIYLTYFSTITLIHLNKCTKLFPQASTAAVVAASCTARIFYDYLLRGSLRFLAGQAGWYIIIAILALAHSRRVEGIGQAAERDIKILQAAIKEMARLWPSSRMFEEGIEKLLNMEPKEIVGPIATMENCPPSLDRNDSLSPTDSIDWRAYFPFISAETSPLIGTLLFNSPAMAAMAVPEIDLAFTLSPQLNNFLLDSEMFELNFLNL
ncbi:hypothetical protein BGW36DRAFT_383036 [Talaromyces proteolyticus]|uniref:Xylanolytic transcriptional activator regulatory domain-containing protein n=1 Tax=Talaromyces proteolyticus TaxID=1131652 RepID=A0AAD4PZF0_9EURO|nr:uncharacterized protein BGW36DRAFT_383036 [Talaromyces proteolyticus]KAH8695624.1 hypothetical protein BGW36DRAFT_383036 [Talaromyces proteolyticus]